MTANSNIFSEYIIRRDYYKGLPIMLHNLVHIKITIINI